MRYARVMPIPGRVVHRRVLKFVCAVGPAARLKKHPEALLMTIARGMEKGRPFVVFVRCVPAFLTDEQSADPVMSFLCCFSVSSGPARRVRDQHRHSYQYTPQATKLAGAASE